MRILDKCSIVNGSGVSRLAIGFELHRCRPLFIKLDIYIKVKGRCVTMALFIVVQHITCIGIKFYFAREFDFGALRFRSSRFLSKRGHCEDCSGSKAEQKIRRQTVFHDLLL